MQIVVNVLCLISLSSLLLSYPIKTVIVGEDDALNITAPTDSLADSGLCSDNRCFWVLGNPLSSSYINITNSATLTLNGSTLRADDSYGFYYYYNGRNILLVVMVRPNKVKPKMELAIHSLNHMCNTFLCGSCVDSTTCKLKNQLLFQLQLGVPEELAITQQCQLFGINITTNRTYFMCAIGKNNQCFRNYTVDMTYVECPLNSSLVNATVTIKSISKHPSIIHCPAPPVINNLIATMNCFNHFNVSWDHTGDVVNITLMQSNALLSTDVTSNDNYYYNNLTAGGNYTITVSGCNNVGCNSDSVNISVSNIIPGSVTDLRTTGYNASSFTITWNDTVTDDLSCRNVTHYLISLSNGVIVVLNTSSLSNTFIVYDLVSNTTYTITVIAVNIAGPGKPATFNVTTDSQKISTRDGDEGEGEGVSVAVIVGVTTATILLALVLVGFGVLLSITVIKHWKDKVRPKKPTQVSDRETDLELPSQVPGNNGDLH
ncbi:uncharacterized protein [Dysidea avara]|uniref:uncharacterized protein isoform X3 n=1 Tax=Dysidea avara TaxID=196820 RepID=UPI0033167626